MLSTSDIFFDGHKSVHYYLCGVNWMLLFHTTCDAPKPGHVHSFIENNVNK